METRCRAASPVTTLLSNASYSGAGGAAQEMTGASLANGVYNETLSYDAMARPTETSITRVSDSALMFDSRRAYDPVGNVANVWTTLPTGTDYQAFCYDEQNRLTYATSATTGSLPCGGSWTAGSLSSANYTNTYSYDTLNRLTSGPGGSYSYGDSHHLDAATAIGSSYTAAYDAAGNTTCRAPTNATTCAGTPTGAQLSYDNEGRLTGWKNQPSSPTTTDSYLYDGEGNRVEQFVSSGATTTAITYVANIEELSTIAGITSTTTYYYAGGQRIAEAVNGAFSYLGSDGLGSAEVALDGSGNVQASGLYDPYGNGRYSSGTMPGTYGFTGQRADSATGLDYYNARYYDAVAAQFISADSVQDGLNRYAYVAGNPETWTDPSGHMMVATDGGGASPTCSSDMSCSTSTVSYTPPPLHYDSKGRCADQHTCDHDRAGVAAALFKQAQKDGATAFLLHLVSLALAAGEAIATKNVLELVEKSLNLLESARQGLYSAAVWLWGPDSGPARFFASIQDSMDAAIEALRLVQGFMAAWGAVVAGMKWVSIILGTASELVEGPVGVLIQLVVTGLAEAGSDISAAAAIAYQNLSEHESDESAEIGGESTYQWCTSGQGNCGAVNWAS